MTEKQKRTQQLEYLKSGVHPGIFVVEYLNSSFCPIKKYEYETQEEAERKYHNLIKSGVYPAFINCYVKFTFK